MRKPQGSVVRNVQAASPAVTGPASGMSGELVAALCNVSYHLCTATSLLLLAYCLSSPSLQAVCLG